MRFHEYLSRLGRTAQRRAGKQRPNNYTPRLLLEVLEDRKLPSITLSGVPTWTPQGPGPIHDTDLHVFEAGAIEAIAAAPAPKDLLDAATNHADNVYVGTVNGGIWHTMNATDHNPNWTPQTDFSSAISIGAIAFSPLDETHQTLYAGTGNVSSYYQINGPTVGMLKTTDGGNAWATLGKLGDHNIRNIIPVVDPVSGGQIVVVSTTDAGVFRSTDDDNWPQISGTGNLPGGAITDLAVDPKDNMRFYAGLPAQFDFTTNPPMVTRNGGVYISTDAGAHWDPVVTQPDTFKAAYDIRLAVHADDPSHSVVYALVQAADGSMSFSYSTDQGVGWTSYSPPSELTGKGDRINLSLAADPVSASIVYIGGDGRSAIWRGNTASGTWKQIGSGTHGDYRRTVFDANNDLLQSDDGGIYRRLEPSVPFFDFLGFQSVNGDIQDTELFGVAYDSFHNIVFGGSQDNGAEEQSAPNDPRWNALPSGDGGVVAIDNTGPYAIRYLRTDGCKVDKIHKRTVVPIPFGDDFIVDDTLAMSGLPLDGHGDLLDRCGTFGLNAVDKSRILVNTYSKRDPSDPANASLDLSGGLYERLPHSDTFTDISGPVVFQSNRFFNTSTVNGVNFVYGGRHGGDDNPDVIYIGVNRNSLWLRDTPGAELHQLTTYNTKFPGAAVVHVAVDPYEWNTVYVTDGTNVYRSTDAGATEDGWTDITGNLGEFFPRAAEFANPISTIEVANPSRTPGHEVVLVGGLGGVFRTFDPSADPSAGEEPHWSPYGTGLPNNITLDLHYYGDADHYGDVPDLLLAGTFGRGAWTVADASATLAVPGILHVSGDTDFPGENDVIRLVRDAHAPALLDVYLNSSTPSLQVELNALEQIDISGLGGNDTLIVDSSNGLINVPTGIYYDGGSGSNRLNLEQPGGDVTRNRDVYSVGPGVSQGTSTITGSNVADTQVVVFQDLAAIEDLVPASRLTVNGSPLIANAISYTTGALVTNGLVTVDPAASFASMEFSNKTILVINGMAGPDTFSINNPNTPAGLERVTVNGFGGSDTLVGSDQNNVWHVTHGDRGTLGSVVFFFSVENLTGGALGDLFQFDPAGAVSGVVNGNGGVNTLDYSAWTSAVTVNLPLGSAPAIFGGMPGGLLDIDNVTGGAGDDLLLGDAGGNDLRGGPGRDVELGDLGKDQLFGGSEDDLLIAGPVTFEKDDAALQAVRAEWTRTDESYLERVGHLCHGGGLNGATLLGPTTVTADLAANTLTGDDGRDWFWADLAGPPADVITDREGGELLGCPTFFVVTNTKNEGLGSLRQAILDANDNPGNDVIVFDIFAAGIQTIRPVSALPDVTDPVIIDGYTQPGSSPNTLLVGNDSVHLIELDGSLAGAASGLRLAANYSAVQGLVINRFALKGIFLQGGGHSVVAGNFIGADGTGTKDLGNGDDGIAIVGSTDNLIGGSAPGERNLISGNDRYGINIQDDAGSVIRQNYIGTDANGQVALSNGSHGVVVQGLSDGTALLDNVVSGNGLDGISLGGTGVMLQGNTIGLNAAGDNALPNASYGITFGARDSVIGGASAAERNLISGNAGGGIRLLGTGNQVLGNFIGTDRTGAAAQANGGVGIVVDGGNENTIRDNLISSNLYDGLRLQAGATGNQLAGNDIRGNQGAGVLVFFGANHNTIGGGSTTRGDNLNRNLISGNGGSGVVISGAGADENRVEGNFIGTDSLGTAALGNSGAGVRIEAGARFNHIGDPGGSAFLTGNLISGNGGNGVEIIGADSTGNIVQTNFIGTDATGAYRLANHGSGVLIEDGADNHIGDLDPAGRNLISGNLQGGVRLTNGAHGNDLRGNYIGTDVLGTHALGNFQGGMSLVDAPDNVVFRNLISANFGDGIHLTGAATTGTQIEQNLIGLNYAGYVSGLGNTGSGVNIDGSPANSVYYNTIVDNRGDGVRIYGTGAADNSVDRNLIFQNIAGIVINGAPGNAIGGVGRSGGWGNDINANVTEGVMIIGSEATGNALARNRILGNGGDGVAIQGAPGNFIGGAALAAGNLISGNRGSGVRIDGAAATGNRIEGNFVGTTSDGAFAQGNDHWGITILAANDTQVGGPGLGQGNVISGNGRTGYDGGGIHIAGAGGNVIQGNRIGTDATGTAALPNHGSGVEIEGSDAVNNLIGGIDAGAGNVIAANERFGVNISGASLNFVQGNRIGADPDGTSALGNALAGVALGGDNNVIGGTLAGAGNIIAFNGSAGVWVVAGAGNAILSNSIHDNAALGIDLGPVGVTDNDVHLDADTGPNGLQNFPQIDAAHSVPAGSTTVTGFLSSEAATTYLIQFFVTNPADPSGHGEGATFLGSVMVTTNLGGGAPLTATLPYVFPGGFISATATRLASSGKGLVARDTSEFSAAKRVTGPLVTPPPGDAPFTAFNANNAALAAILAEWTFAHDYATRIANLQGTGAGARLNGSIFLNYTWTTPHRWRFEDTNRQDFSHRDADAKSLLDEAVRRAIGEAWACEW